MLKIINVVGARPNFMKAAPLVQKMKRREREFTPLLVHTGQHYDTEMSDAFFRDLGLPSPDVHLGVGSAPRDQQLSAIEERFGSVIEEEAPDWVVVVGDVNSTLACARAAKKLGVKVAHVEAGLRSFDPTMPEEANRVETDRIADLLFTPSADANQNLLAENISRDRIRLVGNIMIDSLYHHLEQSKNSGIKTHLGLADKDYAVLTLHRPANVDDQMALARILEAVSEIAKQIPIIFPAHPRTKKNIEQFRLTKRLQKISGLRVIEPLGYLDFLNLYSGARLVLTDSGGIQEETTVLGIPCLTLRENTERPITISQGTNKLVGSDTEKIVREARATLGSRSTAPVIPLWDGHTAERIVDALAE
ncbi:MAG TPA: UDP-N-acetylglucosamine 2-epimerase (non-hydrolyzing) [Pyrinomonadaceae bacterium]|nr:UDP-N-acetylglucosamine 2-epimerase (non-hydrolyzing) [Pyrinomonadaceae bacterium]